MLMDICLPKFDVYHTANLQIVSNLKRQRWYQFRNQSIDLQNKSNDLLLYNGNFDLRARQTLDVLISFKKILSDV